MDMTTLSNRTRCEDSEEGRRHDCGPDGLWKERSGSRACQEAQKGLTDATQAGAEQLRGPEKYLPVPPFKEVQTGDELQLHGAG